MSEYCRVLILDDEFIMRQGMKHMMDWEKEGFQIVGEASDGRQGLELVEKVSPHIVLADIVMPVMDGIEFSEILGKKHPEIQLIILSSYDKFEYVKTTLLNGASDYILKPTLNPENLLKTLRKAAERIPGFRLQAQNDVSYKAQLERVLLGFKDRLDESVFANLFKNTLYRLFVLNVKDCLRGSTNDIFSVKRMVEDFFAEKEEYVVQVMFLQEEILCGVINYRVKDDEDVIKSLDEISQKIRRIYPFAFFVVSGNFSNMQEIRMFYQKNILPEIGKGFYYPEKYLYIAEADKTREKPKRFEFEEYTRELSDKQYEKALSMFQNYIQYLCKYQIEEGKLKNLTKNLLYNYLMETEKITGKSEELRERFFGEIEKTQWVNEFTEAFSRITGNLALLIEEGKGAEDDVIRHIKEYLEEHYQEQLDLSNIAEKFNFSYSYLSGYFSQTVKEGFSGYLNRIRIRHAMEYLSGSPLPISQIGEMVGYTEHSYFCRVFKKITSETPSEYRRRMKRS